MSMLLKLICLLSVFFTVGMTAGGMLFGGNTDFQKKTCNSVFYNYRIYNPIEGRWTTRDPIEEKGELCLYSFLKNEIFNIDYLGQNRYLSSWIFSKKRPSLHVKIAVDIWECVGGQWLPSGECYSYEFYPNYKSSKTLLEILFLEPGVVKEGENPIAVVNLKDYYYFPSSREQDEKLITFLREQIKNPPVYNFMTHNCIHWALEVFFIGMEEEND